MFRRALRAIEDRIPADGSLVLETWAPPGERDTLRPEWDCDIARHS
jgi:hypothetical protein